MLRRHPESPKHDIQGPKKDPLSSLGCNAWETLCVYTACSMEKGRDNSQSKLLTRLLFTLPQPPVLRIMKQTKGTQQKQTSSLLRAKMIHK